MLSRFFPTLLLLWFLALPAHADADKAFLAAREAHRAGQAKTFEKFALRVPDDHLLQPYLRYWRLRGNNQDAQALAACIRDHADSPLSERLRDERARQAARQGDWVSFQMWSEGLIRDDVELRCARRQSALSRGEGPLAKPMQDLYLTGADLPSSCDQLFAQLFAQGLLQVEDRYRRLRLALDQGNLRLARELDGQLPAEERLTANALGLAEKAPERLVAQGAQTRAQQELALYALTAVAKKDVDDAARLWQEHAARYEAAQQRYGWGQIAVQAARRHDPRAMDWFILAATPLSEAQLLWKARTSIRLGRWGDLMQTLFAMPEALQNEAVWRYWKGRAYKALNAPYAANQIFARLSREIHYYGLLAEEELPVRLEKRAADYRASEEEVRQVAALPGMRRALKLRELELLADAVSEWDWALRGQPDPILLAAAELARREQWYDRAIVTAERTREVHDFDLRYLTPYRDLAQAYAQERGLDEAWVYGLMRQESRFIAHARSRAGAQGLMQIMPATAQWIARQLGLKRQASASVGQPDTNIRFGTYYLRSILDDLGGSPVMATAGYNAGPGRARRWQAEVALEGAAYVESIPFAETREYVKKVMANAMYYSQRLGLQPTALKDRLGIIPPHPRVAQQDSLARADRDATQ